MSGNWRPRWRRPRRNWTNSLQKTIGSPRSTVALTMSFALRKSEANPRSTQPPLRRQRRGLPCWPAATTPGYSDAVLAPLCRRCWLRSARHISDLTILSFILARFLSLSLSYSANVIDFLVIDSLPFPQAALHVSAMSMMADRSATQLVRAEQERHESSLQTQQAAQRFQQQQFQLQQEQLANMRAAPRVYPGQFPGFSTVLQGSAQNFTSHGGVAGSAATGFCQHCGQLRSSSVGTFCAACGKKAM